MQRLVLLFILLVFTHCKPEPVKFNVTVQSAPAEGGSVTPPSNMYESGDPASFTATPNQGYVFLRWSGDLSGTNNPAILTIDSEKTITAHFELIPVDTEAPTLVVSLSEQVDTSIAATYVSVYSVTDTASNSASTTHTIRVIDNANADDDGDGLSNLLDQCPNTAQGEEVNSEGCLEIPVPTLVVSPSQQTIEAGENYQTPQVIATDAQGVDISGSLIILGLNAVNINVPDTYVITYSATDQGNTVVSATHTIVVEDTTAPTLTVSPTELTQSLNDPFEGPSLQASDLVDGDLSSQIEAEGLDQIDTRVQGSYTVVYSVQDTRANTAVLTFTLTVEPEDPEGDSDRDGVLNKDDIFKFTTPLVGEEEVNQWGCKTPLYKEVTTDGKITIKSKAWGVVGTFYRLDETEQEYQLVDSATLKNLVDNDEDYTHVCTSRVTSTASLLGSKDGTRYQVTGDITTWDFSNVTNMSKMFEKSFFNQDITHWDVSHVTDMSYMFADADSFVQEIGVWNVSSVTTMQGMFSSTFSFNQPIANWDVSSVTDMSFMFSAAEAFNQNLSSWDVDQVTDYTNFAANSNVNWLAKHKPQF